MQHIIEINNGIANQQAIRMQQPVNLTIDIGEQIAIVGANGSGKSLLVGMLTGKYQLQQHSEVKYNFSPAKSNFAYENIKYIAFRDNYGTTDSDYYYQQRWNSQDLELSPIVSDLLPKTDNIILRDKLYNLFEIGKMLDKHIVMLSSGELRKLQLTKILLSNPRLLIIDNPFVGLDAPTRNQLRLLLEKLIVGGNFQVVIVLSKTDDIPNFISHVIPVCNRIVGKKITLNEYISAHHDTQACVLNDKKRNLILNLPFCKYEPSNNSVVRLNKVTIRYDKRIILKDLSLEVLRGEKWALSGQNGAGKSTLLSLICADNPQAYACDISFFGQNRGSGESIWEIKKHIGYISPEMHRAYMQNIPAIEIVASGLHDSVGLYLRMRPEQAEQCEFWMDIFGILPLKNRNFLELSSGEQRLCLLARAFVKDPDLLILDEPFHGLDLINRRMVKDIIEAFCIRPNKTMIMVTHYTEELPKNITNSLFLEHF